MSKRKTNNDGSDNEKPRRRYMISVYGLYLVFNFDKNKNENSVKLFVYVFVVVLHFCFVFVFVFCFFAREDEFQYDIMLY